MASVEYSCLWLLKCTSVVIIRTTVPARFCWILINSLYLGVLIQGRSLRRINKSAIVDGLAIGVVDAQSRWGKWIARVWLDCLQISQNDQRHTVWGNSFQFRPRKWGNVQLWKVPEAKTSYFPLWFHSQRILQREPSCDFTRRKLSVPITQR